MKGVGVVGHKKIYRGQKLSKLGTNLTKLGPRKEKNIKKSTLFFFKKGLVLLMFKMLCENMIAKGTVSRDFVPGFGISHNDPNLLQFDSQ